MIHSPALIELVAASLLASTVSLLWIRSLRRMITALRLQGVLIALLVLAVSKHHHHSAAATIATMLVIVIAKVIVMPYLLTAHARANEAAVHETPLVNVPMSLIVAAALTLVAHVVMREITAQVFDASGRAMSLGLAMILLGFFHLITRQRAASQIIGLLTLDNGVIVLAILATGGLPIIIDIAASIDVVLAGIALHVLSLKFALHHDDRDMASLRELRDS